MPSTITELLAAAELDLGGIERWPTAIPCRAPGVYLVSSTADPDTLVAPRPCPISDAAIAELLLARPELTVDRRRPKPDELAGRISTFWLPDEPVVYVGLAGTSLRARVGAYYRTRLGARSPHAGGWFLKTLDGLEQLHIHWAVTDDPARAEDRLLAAFCARVSLLTRASLGDPGHPFPFANLEWPPGTVKRHGISGARAPRPNNPRD